MVRYILSYAYLLGLRNPAFVEQERGFAAIQGRFSAWVSLNLKKYLLPVIILLGLICGLNPQAAFAQVGVGFTDNGWYQGTIGSNKGSLEGYKCPNGAVMRGIFHVDKNSPNPPMSSAAGMTFRIDLYCNLVTLDADKQARAYPTTPDGTPAIIGTGSYNGPGVQQDAYCPANQVVTRVGGDSRQSQNTYPAWASDISFVCNGLKILPGDWVAIDTNAGGKDFRAGIPETWLWFHSWSGWICAPGEDRAANGIYRQSGGEGWDGFNIYCAIVRQSRFSARIIFQDFAWQKTLGADGWLVALTKDNKILEQQIYDPATGQYSTISGRDKRPYSTFEGTENDPQTFQYDYELYVLPGNGYGATLSHRPENIPEESYAVTSSCIASIALANHEDKTCDLIVTGRPDIAVSLEVPPEIFVDVGSSQNVTVKGVNLGATTASGNAGFSLDVDIPQGWTAQPVPGCTVSGQKVRCAIGKDLAEAKEWGEKGGDISFTFPIAANINAQVGQFDVVASLGRTAPDATGKPENSDFNKDNDIAGIKILV